jgi:mRNA interferase YafQ
MKILNPIRSNRFKRDFKLMQKRGKNPDKFKEVANFLVKEFVLPEKYKDHKLQGNYKNCRECHIEPDWLLIYRVTTDSVVFERTGTHSDLFKK